MSSVKDEIELLQIKKDIETIRAACNNLQEENQELSYEIALLNASKKRFPKMVFKQNSLGESSDGTMDNNNNTATNTKEQSFDEMK